jgi:hypothetical protein
MKTTSKITALLLVGTLAAALQANALTFTESLNNINAEVEGVTYTGTFSGANLLSGSTVFNNTLYTISSATVDITMLNAAGHQTSLIIDAFTQNLTPSTSPQVLVYTLNSTQDSYIQTKNGTFNFGVTADCELLAAELIVTTTASNVNHVPDAASTALLLGASMCLLALLKRKGMIPAR